MSGTEKLARNKEIEKFAEHSKFQFIQWSSDKPTTFPFIFFIFWVLNWVWKEKTGKLLRKTFFGFCACLWLEVEWNKNFYGDLSKLWWKFDKVSLKQFNAISLDYSELISTREMLRRKSISFAKCFESHKAKWVCIFQ